MRIRTKTRALVLRTLQPSELINAVRPMRVTALQEQPLFKYFL